MNQKTHTQIEAAIWTANYSKEFLHATVKNA